MTLDDEHHEREAGELRRLLAVARTCEQHRAAEIRELIAQRKRLAGALVECAALANELLDSRDHHARVVAGGIVDCAELGFRDIGMRPPKRVARALVDSPKKK